MAKMVKKGSKNGNHNNNHNNDDHDDSDSSSVSSEEAGEDLILEGVLIRNSEVASSSDEEEEEEQEQPRKKKAKLDVSSAATQKSNSKSNSTLKSKSNDKAKANSTKKNDKKPSSSNNKSNSSNKKKNEPEIMSVEFTFNDMNEHYFHGIQNYLSTQQPIYTPHSTTLADLILQNVSVGTVISTDDGEHNVFGFASVLNITTHTNNNNQNNNNENCIKSILQSIQSHCPKEHLNEMNIVLSGRTKRPAGLFIHGRMVNVPLEISLVLHEQLVLDMDWAVDHAMGGEEERKSLNFGAFVLLAPCYKDDDNDGGGTVVVYRNFEDEIFAGCAEFVYSIDVSQLNKKKKKHDKNHNNKNHNNNNFVGEEENKDHSSNNLINVIVMTKTGHRDAMKEMKQLVNG